MSLIHMTRAINSRNFVMTWCGIFPLKFSQQTTTRIEVATCPKCKAVHDAAKEKTGGTHAYA
jgi:hypothetical protein